jgi:hypothetical protein
MQHAGQHGPATPEIAAIGLRIRHRGLHRGAGDGGQALGRSTPVGLRRIHTRELQRHGGNVEFGIGQATGGIEGGAGLILAEWRHDVSLTEAGGVIKADVACGFRSQPIKYALPCNGETGSAVALK